jgi:ABC-type nitrate/sulfonate/bicarbonate transport system ATPase subunit
MSFRELEDEKVYNPGSYSLALQHLSLILINSFHQSPHLAAGAGPCHTSYPHSALSPIFYKLLLCFSFCLQQMDTPSSDTSGVTDEKDTDSLTPERLRDVETWPITRDVRQLDARLYPDGSRRGNLGVTWQDLTVKGVSNDAMFNENVLSQFNPFGKSGKSVPDKTIIDSSSGCVKPGEMLLVLGRPGAGCTSLLSILANRRLGYSKVEGQVSFGSMSHKEAEQYRGQIVMNTEEEIFFPALTVKDTIDFATRLKVPHTLPSGVKDASEYAQINEDFFLKAMGIEHTKDTKVGDAYIRGVSGGERKRVSIVECLATRGSVFCWDNSVRPLKSSIQGQY